MGKNNKNLNMVLALDKTTFGLEVKNYYPLMTKKTQIILAGSLRKDSNHIIHLQSKDFGMTKRWPTFSITRNGKIYQHYDPFCYSDFMNIKDIDKKSISIVLENMGMLSFDANKGFMNWINEYCNDKLVGQKLWKNGRYWETYTEKQYESLTSLCLSLTKEHGITLDAIGTNALGTHKVELEKVEEFEGIVTRSNYDSDYTDLNPLFEFDKFLKMLNISTD